MLLDLSLSAPLHSHVRVECDEAVVWYRHAAHAQHGSIGPGAFHVVGREYSGSLHALVNLALSVAIAVFTTFCVEADKTLERCANIGHFQREIQQGEKRQIPSHHVQVFVDKGVALVDQIQAGLK